MSEYLEELGAELTGGAGVPNEIDDDTPLPNELAAAVEEYDAYAELRDAHVVKEDDTDDDQQQHRGPRSVPLGALQEERRRRQAIEADLAQARAQQLAQQQQFEQMLLQQQQMAQQQQEQPIDFSEDPEGYIKQKERQFEQRLADVQGQQQVAVQRAHVQQVIQAGTQAEQAFMAEVGEDNYRQAFDAVNGQVLQALRQSYPQATEQELQQVQLHGLMTHAQQCLAQGRNPAQALYERAQALGFKPGHRVPGQARPTAPTSLSSLPSGAYDDGGGRLTAAKVNAMSDSEFAALVAGMKRSAHAGPGV